MPVLRLSWLGPPAIEVAGRPLRLEMRKTLALLAYLSLSPQSPSRETLATLFWPEYDQQHSLTNLRRNLSSLTRSLPSGLFETDRERIGLKREHWLQIDVDEFRDLLSTAKEHSHSPEPICPDCLSSLEKAVAIYRGDFLEGFNLKDCPEFDEWQFFQQEGLRSEMAGALEKLAAIYQDQGEWEQAIRYARSWVALDRLNEPAQRLLIRLYHQSGQRSMALRQYEILVDLLQNELGQAPEAETLALSQNLLPGKAAEIVENGPPQPGSTARGAEPLIKTKLFIPPLRVKRVARPRLFELLDAGSQRSLTLISAPAGFGKTTLLASWTAHTSLPIAWFSMDEGDNDPVRFVAYLIAALDSILSANLSEQFQSFIQALRPSIQPTLVQLINYLAGEREPFVLILDDYQFIHSQDVHTALAFLLEKIPACMHLIIATRSDPPISLALLRARDQLVEIRMSDLRFRAEESAGFLQQVMALHLSNEDVSSLEARTEGWIAGLQMAALAIRTVASQFTRGFSALDSGQAVSQFIKAFSGSNRYILDYLGEEVLSRSPKEIHSFLLQTSILDRFSGPLCDAVTQTEGSQKILETLEKANLFVVPLDSERHWYRYHHLFGELLRYRLEEKLDKRSDPERQILPTLEELHLRAALWFEEQNLPDQAIQHTLSAKKFERAAGYIEKHAHDMLFRYGELYTLAKWLAAIPAGIFQARPRINIVQAWVMIFRYQFESPVETLNTTLQAIQMQQTAESASLLGEIALIQGIYAELVSRDVQAMREQALLAWERLPEQDAMLRGLAAWLLGASYYHDGDNRNAVKYYQNAIRLCREAGNIYSTVLSIADMCNALREEGRYREAYRLLIKTQQDIASSKWQHPMLGLLYINSSHILLQWNELDQAEQQLLRGLELIAQSIPGEIYFFGIAILPLIKLNQGKREEAIHLAKDCLDRLEAYPLPFVTLVTKANLVRFWIRVNDREQVEDWLNTCGIAVEEPILYRHKGEHFSFAKVLVWQGRPREALTVLSKLYEFLTSAGQDGKILFILAIEALAYQQLKETEKALEVLESSLKLAKPEGHIRAYLDEGRPMEELLQLGAARGIWERAGLGPYVKRLLAAFQSEANFVQTQPLA